ncbi:GNAT family N-acetyltransferase [Candidatus Marinamargulisbacteria bacterium SCGC AG-414-C22]|nr:GNAT family N-acetyltransferase [Candidatus Marinamargulisbacteria bacterium SCGC AG-414-C22]
MEYTIRKMDKFEYFHLETFLYEAIFQRENEKRLPKDVIKRPDLLVYIEAFGKHSDLCLVAENNNRIIGCVWTRIISGEIKGYGNVDNKTPEFAISILKNFRRQGIGTALMKAMLQLLKDHRYDKTSLSVQKDNFAVKLYEKVGFKKISETKEDYLMICKL